ncbi:MAG TPA: TetR family transcriptional regulator C-terminal domain-containing protein [Solirubrobacterales bacterium]|jgi:DNA-binding transcriptional regulator YbjK|nr:TetR family transcriptional regulator C-terminal domain-containing protein [Solirubrobacterales bacterium]
MTGPRATRKRELAAGAALTVLANQGSRGLTHRAVDQQAELPLGSTSNYFRTRSALLEAALARHIELDLPPAELVERIGDARLDREAARGLIFAALARVIDPEAKPMIAARYELMLESTRRPELRRRYTEARERVTDLAEMVLRASGCGAPRRHALELVVLMDGIALDQLMEADSTLDREGIEAALDRFLAGC